MVLDFAIINGHVHGTLHLGDEKPCGETLLLTGRRRPVRQEHIVLGRHGNTGFFFGLPHRSSPSGCIDVVRVDLTAGVIGGVDFAASSGLLGQEQQKVSALYGRLAVICMGEWECFVWAAGSDFYGRVAVIGMGGWE